jgi:predicted glutamine amidotransferase
MCIAIYKDKGVLPPKKKLLKTCWNKNPDGAGFFIIDPVSKQSVVSKGFLTFDEFWWYWKDAKIRKSDKVGIHFRIGTSGGVTHKQTHPFPITRKTMDMKIIDFVAEDIIMHNGVIGEGEGALSDTMKFIRDVITTKLETQRIAEVLEFLEQLDGSPRNRFCMVLAGQVYLTGKWITFNGLNFSNDLYGHIKED